MFEPVSTKKITRAGLTALAVTALAMPIFVFVISETFIVEVLDVNRYLASTSVFVFGVALVSGLLTGERSESQESPETGVVKWFNTAKGFGFITLEGGRDVFVHYRDILGKGHRSLSTGQKVAFQITKGPKGPQAQKVTVLG